MVEVKCVNARLKLEAGALEASVDGTVLPSFQFHVGEPFQSRRHAEIPGRGFSDGRLQVSSHRLEIQLLEFLFEKCHRIPFRLRG